MHLSSKKVVGVVVGQQCLTQNIYFFGKADIKHDDVTKSLEFAARPQTFWTFDVQSRDTTTTMTRTMMTMILLPLLLFVFELRI